MHAPFSKKLLMGFCSDVPVNVSGKFAVRIRTRLMRSWDNKMPRYRRDHRAMRPIYECPQNNVSAQNQPTCAWISTLQPYHYSAVKLFSISHPMWSRHLVTYKRYRRTDGRTLWHHRAVKIGRQIIADIIGITDILSQRYRYIVDFKKPTCTITTH